MIELTLPDMTCGHCVKTVTGTGANNSAVVAIHTSS